MDEKQRHDESLPNLSNLPITEKRAPEGNLLSLKFFMMTNTEVEKLSSLTAFRSSDLTSPSLGLPNLSGECSTCNGSSMRQCDGHTGCIKLQSPIYHPYYVEKLVQILNGVCFMCKSARKSKRTKSRFKIAQKHASDVDRPGCTYCNIHRRKWKFKALKEMSNLTISIEITGCLPNMLEKKGIQDRLDPGVTNIVLHPFQVFQLLKDLERNLIDWHILRRDLLFLSCLPVPPNCCRLTESRKYASSSKAAFDTRTKALKSVVNLNGLTDDEQQHRDVPYAVLDSLHLSKLHPKYQSRSTSSNVSGMRWIKEVVLSKRTDHVCRMTVVGDPTIRLNEIGIPKDICKCLTVPEVITCHNIHIWNAQIENVELRDIYVRRNSKLCFLNDLERLHIGDILSRPLKDGDLLLVNRPPSIHQHSMIALSVKTLPTAAVFSLNPLCCAPLYGDFDGDCLHAYIPQSIHSKIELQDLVHLDKQLLNGQDNRSLISLSQDSLTASHLLLRDMAFLNKFAIQQLELSSMRFLPSPAIIKAPLAPGPLWTGQQLFNVILPEGFEFSIQSGLVNISNGEVLVSPADSLWLENKPDGLFSKICRSYSDMAIKNFTSAQKIFCEWISARGLSVSLEDLFITSHTYDQKKLIQEVEACLREGHHACFINCLLLTNINGMNYFNVSHKRKDISNSGNDDPHHIVNSGNEKDYLITNPKCFLAFKEVFSGLENIVQDFVNKSNSMLLMIKAGSKGSLSKFLQQSVCVGLQFHAASYKIAYTFSCADWNKYRFSHKGGILPEKSYHEKTCGSCSVIRSSFIDGLNPLEFFLVSSSGRMNLFSDNAEYPGTLTRKLMFYLRDIRIEYDRTVRSSYGPQIIKFPYENPALNQGQSVNTEVNFQGGHPIGALAACSISDAAYSALDLPNTFHETSPLASLRKAFELGQKRSTSGQIISLALSHKLKRWDYGYEYAALKIQQHLKGVYFSDVVCKVLIFYAGQNVEGNSPWIIHFHLNKERMAKHRLSVNKIGDIILSKYKLFKKKTSIKFPVLQISGRSCLVDSVREEQTMDDCISISAENSVIPVDLDYTQNTLMPLLLRTVIKGYHEVKEVDIKWEDHVESSGLYLRVIMSESCKQKTGWNFLLLACLPIMDLIDWNRSHPISIFDTFTALGIDAAWRCFVRDLKAATVKIGKQIQDEHLHLVADSLSATGEFHSLTGRGLKLQREQQSINSPLLHGFFSTPAKNFINAAKKGEEDRLLGAVEAMAWGKEASFGSNGPFKLLWKEPNLDAQGNVYQMLKQTCASTPKASANYHERAPTGEYSGHGVAPEPYNLKASLRKILHK
ncbi:nuclear RNA polymerase D1A isoform X2 [Wolffia australiana]